MNRVLRIVMVMLAISVCANVQAALLYTRANITILRAAPPADALLPWEDPSQPDKGLVIDTEIRDGTARYPQKGWLNVSAPPDRAGVMMAFSAPAVVPISPSEQYAPLDVIMIDKEGKIVQIVPDLLLSALEKDVYPEMPVLAFLFLKGGACKKFSIRPGDWVAHPLFKKPPALLTVPISSIAP